MTVRNYVDDNTDAALRTVVTASLLMALSTCDSRIRGLAPDFILDSSRLEYVSHQLRYRGIECATADGRLFRNVTLSEG